MTRKSDTKQRRVWRTRSKVKKVANGRARLSVFRSTLHIYAQVIDDVNGLTLASASTMDAELKAKLKKKTSNKDAAEAVGKLVAERAKKSGVEQVVFDRGRFLYHGRVKALGDAAREAGLSF